MSRAYVPVLLACLCIPAFVSRVAAAIDEQTVSYTFNYFTDVDGVNVYSHFSGTQVELDRRLALSVQWGHDEVVFPAIEAAPGSQEAIDAITTASRPLSSAADAFEDFVKVRDSLEGSITYRGLNAGYYVSKESDYFAQMVTTGYNHDFLLDNLNVALGSSYSWDAIEPLADADTPGISDYRRTIHGNLVTTYTATPTTVVRAGAEINRVTGLQHDPYRNVYVAGTNVPELHPVDRDRHDAFLRVSQYLTNRSSIKVDYRYYDDTWGVSSHTFGGRLSQYVTDRVVIRYRYRYYTQLGATFFRDEYTAPGGVAGYQTGDYRLGDYGAHLLGGHVLWMPRADRGRLSFLKNARMFLSYERYFNSNNFSANIYETGLQVSF